MGERGVIQNRARKKQINDFRNLRYGTITPTDIDGFIDFGNRVFVWFELKYDTAPRISDGQRLALERMCDSAMVAGKVSYVILAKHFIRTSSADVDVAAAIVVEFRYERKWESVEEGITVRQFIDRILCLSGYDVPIEIDFAEEGCNPIGDNQ